MAITVNVTYQRKNKDYYQESLGDVPFGDVIPPPPANLMPYFHWEKGMLTNLENSSDDHTIQEPFKIAFDQTPIVEKFEVYRMAVYGGGYRRKNVVFTHSNSFPDLDGFEIEIHETEDLTGVIIEYIFVEQ